VYPLGFGGEDDQEASFSLVWWKSSQGGDLLRGVLNSHGTSRAQPIW